MKHTHIIQTSCGVKLEVRIDDVHGFAYLKPTPPPPYPPQVTEQLDREYAAYMEEIVAGLPPGVEITACLVDLA